MTQHSKESERLREIELDLINLIGDTGNTQLMDKFIQWQGQRVRCNKEHLKAIESTMSEMQSQKNLCLLDIRRRGIKSNA